MFKRTFIKYIILSIASITLTEITYKTLNFQELLYNSLIGQLTKNEIKSFFDFQNRWHWLSNIIPPLLILIKSIVISGVIYIGNYFFSKKTTTFKQLWDFVINAEFIFLLIPIIKIIWFYFFQSNYKLEDIQYFYPLSALNIIGYKGLEPWFLYPFQTLNLFELAYWLILAYYIGKATETNMDKGLKIVAYSYGPALLLWVITIMFFTLNYS